MENMKRNIPHRASRRPIIRSASAVSLRMKDKSESTVRRAQRGDVSEQADGRLGRQL